MRQATAIGVLALAALGASGCDLLFPGPDDDGDGIEIRIDRPEPFRRYADGIIRIQAFGDDVITCDVDRGCVLATFN